MRDRSESLRLPTGKKGEQTAEEGGSRQDPEEAATKELGGPE